MEITTNQNKAVNDIVEMVVSVIGKGSRELDTISAISATARLAGSFLFRSFDFKIDDAKPGTVMLSEDANTKGPQLVHITHAVLHNFGIQIDNSKMSNGNSKYAESSFLDVITQIQDPALEIMKNNELSFEQMAQSAAIATAFIIQQSINISPEEGFGTAIYHYIEGTKTFPPNFSGEAKETLSEPPVDTPMQAKSADDASGKDTPKPWWKVW